LHTIRASSLTNTNQLTNLFHLCSLHRVIECFTNPSKLRFDHNVTIIHVHLSDIEHALILKLTLTAEGEVTVISEPTLFKERAAKGFKSRLERGVAVHDCLSNHMVGNHAWIVSISIVDVQGTKALPPITPHWSPCQIDRVLTVIHIAKT